MLKIWEMKIKIMESDVPGSLSWGESDFGRFVHGGVCNEIQLYPSLKVKTIKTIKVSEEVVG